MDINMQTVGATGVRTHADKMLPDLSVLSSPEIEIPTLTLQSPVNMESDPLNGISLSGIINQFIHLPQEQDQSEANNIVYHMTPVNNMMQSQQYHNTYNLLQGDVCPPQAEQIQKPFIRIVEQPKSNSLRFRYQCEGRGAGALQGQHSSQERKTYPKIQIVGTNKKAVVVVSCVTHDTDIPRAHPHNLVSPASVGKDGCKRGVCTLHVSSEDMTVEFQHLGIQCVRKKDIEDSLKQRKEIRVDPFKQGFKHIDNASSIDLNAVKLCFQAFLEDPKNPGKFTVPLDPICSSNIFDAKARKELQVMDISDIMSPAEGGKKILIFCEKVAREDIKVRFYDNKGWEGWGEFTPSDVHKQYGIALKTPKYRDGNIKEKTKVFLELFKPSDESVSEPQDFFFYSYDGVGSNFSLISNGNGHDIKHNFTAFNGYKDMKDLKIKQETTDWAQNRLSGVYPGSHGQYTNRSQTGPDPSLLNIQRTSGYNNTPTAGASNNNAFIQQQQQQNYIPNIPNVHQGYPGSIPPSMPQLMNPYTCQQPSPDSQGFANMHLASPQHKQDHQYQVDDEIENVSGKLESFSLSDAIETSLNMQGMHAPQEEPRPRGKRSQQTAALESGSNVVPREMARLGSGQVGAGGGLLDTPDCSGQISGGQPANTGHMSGYLNNCRQINDL